MIVVWALIGLDPVVRWREVGIAVALQVLLGGALWWHRSWERSRMAGFCGIGVFLVSVALLRDGVGQTVSGYGSLALLAVLWAAARERRGELLFAVVGTAGVEFVPQVLIGAPQYPAAMWRAGALLVVVVAVVGVSVRALVTHLTASERLHRLLANNSSDLVARVTPDGTFLYASPASLAVLGREPEWLIGRTLAELTHPDDVAQRAARIRRIDSAAQGGTRLARMRHADGRWRWLEATVRPLRGPGGDVIERQLAFRDVTQRVQNDEETRALSRIATLVAAGEAPTKLFRAIAEELATVFDASVASVVRFDAATATGAVVGISERGSEKIERSLDLTGSSAAAQVFQTRRAVRIEDYRREDLDPAITRMLVTAAVGAPVTVAGDLWGAVGAGITHGTIPDALEERLARFAELLSLAIANAQALESLAQQAAIDPLTGVGNRRVFHARLREEADRARRYGHPLCVVAVDVDRFKQINDTYGHPAGDRALSRIAQELVEQARSGDLVARIGGDEFAWLMPETESAEGHAAVERARQAIASLALTPIDSLTISAGVFSTAEDISVARLLQGADQALYLAKQAGRDRTAIRPADHAGDLTASGGGSSCAM